MPLCRVLSRSSCFRKLASAAAPAAGAIFFLCSLISGSAAADPNKIQIEFIAAAFSVDQTVFPPKIVSSRAGWDVVFHYDIDQQRFVWNSTDLLSASGETTASAICSKTLTSGGLKNVVLLPHLNLVGFNGDNTRFFIHQPGGSLVLMAPGTDGAGICDQSQFVEGSGLHVQRADHYVPSSFPGTPDTADYHSSYASLELNPHSPFGSYYFSYDGDSAATDVLGRLTESWKVVWFGSIIVRPETGQDPAPTDPFTYLGYVPPSALGDTPNPPPIVLVASNLPPPGQPAPNPVPAPAPAQPPVKATGDWLKRGVHAQFSKAVEALLFDRTRFMSPKAKESRALVDGKSFTFDARLRLIRLKSAGTAPGTGVLTETIKNRSGILAKIVDPDSGRTGMKVAAGANPTVTLQLSAAGYKAIKKGRPISSDYVAMLAPGGKLQSIEVKGRVKLKPARLR